ARVQPARARKAGMDDPRPSDQRRLPPHRDHGRLAVILAPVVARYAAATPADEGAPTLALGIAPGVLPAVRDHGGPGGHARRAHAGHALPAPHAPHGGAAKPRARHDGDRRSVPGTPARRRALSR